MENRGNIFKGAIFWLLLATFFKGVIWSGIVPLWHFPDEQAHFAQLQNIAEGHPERGRGGTTSQEIFFSEEILGTLRNDRGNNRFTFHPEYNLDYTKDFSGVYEKEIQSLPIETRKEMVIAEATGYPPFYYLIGSMFYKLAYGNDLFVRAFFVRILSILLMTTTVWLVYKIGLLAFRKRLMALSLGILVSFQPMFTFAESGVSSDVLFNFFFTFFIWAGLLVFSDPGAKSFGLLISSLVGGLLVKPQMIIAVLIAVLPLVIVGKQTLSKKKELNLNYSKLTVSLIGISVLFYLAFRFSKFHQISGFISAGKENNPISLIEHLIWTVRHIIAEVLPWYWGVFKWLGVVLPRWVNQVQMRLLGLTILGLLIYLIKIIRQKKLKARDWQIGFLGLTALTYFLAVTLWNWQFRIAYGFPFGIQGRYFFPTIVSHMAIILVGLTSLASKKFIKWIVMALSAWWITLSFIGSWTIIKAYYQTWPLQTLWWQISQYKPFWFKAEWWFLWLALFLIALLGLLAGFLREFNRYEAKKA